MVSYNVTYVIDHAYHKAWLSWMKNVHIPDVMMTLHFVEYKFWKLENLGEEEGMTYNVQYIAESQLSIEAYLNCEAKKLQEIHKEKWDGKFLSFRSQMQLVQKG